MWLIDRLFFNKRTGEIDDETEENPDASPSKQGCADEACGIRSICPSEQILAGECKQQPTYYEDEELDAQLHHHADREGDFAHRVAFVVMEATLHSNDFSTSNGAKK